MVRAHALATLANILLVGDRAAEALAPAQAAMEILRLLGSVEEGEALIRLVYTLALQANGEQRLAEESASTARRRIRARANRITDPWWRRKFVDGIPEHARTRALSLGDPTDPLR